MSPGSVPSGSSRLQHNLSNAAPLGAEMNDERRDVTQPCLASQDYLQLPEDVHSNCSSETEGPDLPEDDEDLDFDDYPIPNYSLDQISAGLAGLTGLQGGPSISSAEDGRNLNPVVEGSLGEGSVEVAQVADEETAMINFVAKNFKEQMQVSRKGSSATSIASSLPSPSSPTKPQEVLDRLHSQATAIADSVHLMCGNLTAQLHNMSALTVTCLQTYQNSVDKTCDMTDSTIKTMYALMAKCEELSQAMKLTPVDDLKQQLREINRLLDIFESKIDHGGSKKSILP